MEYEPVPTRTQTIIVRRTTAAVSCERRRTPKQNAGIYGLADYGRA